MGTIIILYDESEELFTSLGLGVLNDCISCEVSESLNDSFELTLEYPIKGSNYSKIKIGRIIGAKPNPYDSIQPFRIASITKPINGIVTIMAYHLSYDMNGIPCKAIDAASLSETLVKIKENCLIENNFTFKTDVQFSRKFKTSAPYNVRALLMGDEEESLIGIYNAELKFDKYSVYLYSKRGKNRGARVCYGNNMIDLTHESTNERLYNGVFPYYHTETETTETSSSDSFTKTYIVGSKPFQDGWLSFSKNGEAYHPVDSTPVQIDTEGEYYEKVYSWNSTYQKYEEKIYNATVTIMEGVIEPSWIVIDWSTFPVIVCRANAKGYFKLATETDWGEIKGVGDVIFQGNILTSGLTNMASNMIIGYSEVLPPNHTSTSQTSVSSVDVVLDDPIIWLNTTDAKTMKYNRVLSLDLTSEFEEQPTQDKLKAKAEEYINKNLVGTAKYSTTVSFVDLSSTTDAEKYTNFDHVEIGDTVKVIYKDLGVDVDLRVISATYDAITDNYISVELGEKPDKFSASSIQNGDNISSLSNDVGYADITTVHKLIADTVTADYIQAVNASMSNAQIKFLEVAKISCSGIFEASQLVLDEIVARMLTAENAKISQTLEAGEIKVAGDISIKSGSINITSDDNNTSFIVDRDGNVTANSIQITGGTISIVSDNGTTFEVEPDGTLYANSAKIEGEIVATSGVIGGCKIEDGILIVESANIESISADQIEGGTISSSQIKIGRIGQTENYNFTVNSAGEVLARSITITGGNINISGGTKAFTIRNDGSMEGNSVYLKGGHIENLNITGNLYFESNMMTVYERSNSYNVLHTVTLDNGAGITVSFSFIDSNHDSYQNGNIDDIDIIRENGYEGIAVITDNGTSVTVNITILYDNGSYNLTAASTGEILKSSYNVSTGTLNLTTPPYSYTSPQIEYTYNSNLYKLTFEQVEESSADSQVVYSITSDGMNITHVSDYHFIGDVSSYIITNDDIDFRSYKYKEDWLSEDLNDGDPLIPDEHYVYQVYDSTGNRLIGYYKWNGSSYEVTEESYHINQNGIYLPGMISTIYETIIAGFTISNNRLTSSTDTTEVGISSAESDTYAFWAGKKPDAFSSNPFYVTRTGELHSTAGNIGSFYITEDHLTTNPYKDDIFKTRKGLFLNSTGIGFYNENTRTRVVVDSDGGILTPNLLIDPFKRNINPNNYADPSLVRSRLGGRTNVLLNGWLSLDSYQDSTTTPRIWTTYLNSRHIFCQSIPSDNSYNGKPITITANTTRTFYLATELPYSDIDADTNIYNVFVSVFADPNQQQLSNAWYNSYAPLVSYDNTVDSNGYKKIYVRNNNSRTIYVKLLVMYVRNDITD